MWLHLENMNWPSFCSNCIIYPAVFIGPECFNRLDNCQCAQLCLTLCSPMDCSLSGFSAHGIVPARMLEWVAISSSRGSSQPRNRTWVSWVSCLQADSLPLSLQQIACRFLVICESPQLQNMICVIIVVVLSKLYSDVKLNSLPLCHPADLLHTFKLDSATTQQPRNPLVDWMMALQNMSTS